MISDAHAGLKAAIAKVLHASWQRCRVHFMRNVLAYAGKQGRRVVAAFIGTRLFRTMPKPLALSGVRWPIDSGPRWPNSPL